MKIAICISGILRTWEQTKKSFMEKLIKDIDYDLFIHTYSQNLYENRSERPDKILTEEQINSLFTGLNIKSLVIEDRDKILPKLTKTTERP